MNNRKAKKGPSLTKLIRAKNKYIAGLSKKSVDHKMELEIANARIIKLKNQPPPQYSPLMKQFVLELERDPRSPRTFICAIRFNMRLVVSAFYGASNRNGYEIPRLAREIGYTLSNDIQKKIMEELQKDSCLPMGGW